MTGQESEMTIVLARRCACMPARLDFPMARGLVDLTSDDMFP